MFVRFFISVFLCFWVPRDRTAAAGSRLLDCESEGFGGILKQDTRLHNMKGSLTGCVFSGETQNGFGALQTNPNILSPKKSIPTAPVERAEA